MTETAVVGYLGVALLTGVTAALLVVVANRASLPVRLFLRCLRWGVTTGAVTGAVVGAMVMVVSQPELIFVGLFVGAFFGILVSLIPTLIGTVFITDLLRHRHPQPASDEDLRPDLTSAFRFVVGALDLLVVVILVASGAGSSVVVGVPFLLVANACMALMLWRARRSISRLWSGTAHQVAPAR